jgi:hypothetical protein
MFRSSQIVSELDFGVAITGAKCGVSKPYLLAATRCNDMYKFEGLKLKNVSLHLTKHNAVNTCPVLSQAP